MLWQLVSISFVFCCRPAKDNVKMTTSCSSNSSSLLFLYFFPNEPLSSYLTIWFRLFSSLYYLLERLRVSLFLFHYAFTSIMNLFLLHIILFDFNFFKVTFCLISANIFLRVSITFKNVWILFVNLLFTPFRLDVHIGWLAFFWTNPLF